MYNKYMGGVDRFDENVDSMRVALRGKKWWFLLFAFGLDASCQNAWLIKRNSENNWTYCDFRRNVATIYLQKYGKSPTRNSACGVPVQIRVPTEMFSKEPDKSDGPNNLELKVPVRGSARALFQGISASEMHCDA
ncbi:Chimeric ERCC6-PGBD3 protein [Eumeta japonica]|uniref:Chimeric ERCC6-PGBD3 protein n=1 Tax=Eumeta variegata TaxID=151549 RepID=A0A4C1XA26_EUMVA|nr:Chimeric ERCC6-PGBD3 protein [Eumeta japonica]